MNEQALIKHTIHEFSKVDLDNLFSFSSGHLGALPISDRALLEMLQIKSFKHAVKNGFNFSKEFFQFVFLSIFPIKNLALIIRTLLRRTFNKKINKIHSVSVISLGMQPFNKDTYFGILLAQIEEEFNYLKIVGGFNFKSKDYLFVESALEWLDLIGLALNILLTPFLSFRYLVKKSALLKGFNNKIIFIVMGLKEINSSSFCNNKIIVDSIKAWLKNNNIKKIMYPMEGRSWEKSIVNSMNIRKIYSIGYVHCSLTPRHLSLIQTGFYLKNEIPVVIVSPGEMISKLLLNTFPKTTIIKGYFLRGDKGEMNNAEKIRTDTVLFALIGSKRESTCILDFLAKSDISKKYNLIIRLNSNTSSYKYLSSYAEKLNLTLYTGREDFLPSICFFRSSSVALDYLKLNVLPIYLTINEVISNNTFELDNKFQFESIQVDTHFNDNLQQLIDREIDKKLDGVEVVNFYLDKKFNVDKLKLLLVECGFNQ